MSPSSVSFYLCEGFSSSSMQLGFVDAPQPKATRHTATVKTEYGSLNFLCIEFENTSEGE